MKIALVLITLFAISSMASTKVVRHPHFPKKIEMSLGMQEDSPALSVSHLTVTFNKSGFEETKPGGAWHLANSHLVTETDLTIGGASVEAGDYRLLARKNEAGAWDLVLDPKGKPFRNSISDEAISLETTFEIDQPVSEHLRIDLQPVGDDTVPVIRLEVHFSTYFAHADIMLAE